MVSVGSTAASEVSAAATASAAVVASAALAAAADSEAAALAAVMASAAEATAAATGDNDWNRKVAGSNPDFRRANAPGSTARERSCGGDGPAQIYKVGFHVSNRVGEIMGVADDQRFPLNVMEQFLNAVGFTFSRVAKL